MTTESAANHVRSTSEQYALRLYQCSAAAIRDIQVQRGSDGNVLANNHGAGLTIDGILSRQCGLGTVGQNLVDISGTSAVARATGVSITNSDFLDNFGGNNNNATEFSWVTGLTISDCTYRRILGNAV